MTGQPQGIVPHLVVDDASAALEFYARALGATELMRLELRASAALGGTGLTVCRFPR